ncbi:MAG: glycosyltransferase family 2 protein [Aeriscardovia sp.]|nr:glycosyltransferase family 2 protein [Aeriscardovia sp.]
MQDESPFFSVIVPVYNTEAQTLRRCLESIRQQHADFEAIIIDDGSTNGNALICDEYGTDARFHISHQSNAGVSAARNNGLSQAHGAWIYFVDSDDYLSKTALSDLHDHLQALEITDDADIVAFNLQDIQPDGVSKELTLLPFYHDQRLSSDERESILLNCIANGYNHTSLPDGYIPVWTKLYRRDFLRQNGIRFNMDLAIGEDLTFNIECLMKTTQSIAYLTLYPYCRNRNNASASASFKPDIEENDACLIKELTRILNVYHYDGRCRQALTKRYVIALFGIVTFDMAHPQNTKPLIERAEDISSLLKREPYHTALRQCHLSWFMSRDQVKVFLLKKRQYKLYLEVHATVKIAKKAKHLLHR